MKQIANMLGTRRYFGLTAYQIALLAVLVVVLFFLSDSSVTKRIRYESQIRDLESQIEYYRQQTESDREKLHELQSNDDDLEKFARENYLMKKENEDIFIIQE
ncbi:MAG: septum formation initiator family protein [Proteiniphilum sp.]|jgi:cell division protein FtsB|nr:septum formation initiator family protein [Proteiniphilum sp.]